MEDLNKIKLMETTKATFKKINDNFTAVEEAIENNEGAIDNKANKASGLSAGTKTKISYNNEGIVTGGQDATLDDIADGTTRKLSDYLTKTEAGSTYIPQSQKGQANGVATLDSGGKVPSSQLPSYVDDVLEYASISNFPATGESGKIYVALDTNLTYRWGGSEYVEISQSLALGETASTAYAGNKGKQNADDIATLKSYFTEGGGGATPFVVGDSVGKMYFDTSDTTKIAVNTFLENLPWQSSGASTIGLIGYYFDEESEGNQLLAIDLAELTSGTVEGYALSTDELTIVYSTVAFSFEGFGIDAVEGWQNLDENNAFEYSPAKTADVINERDGFNGIIVSATPFGGGAKAKDADKLDGHDSTYFATKQSVDDIDTILDGFGDIVTHNANEFQTKLTSQTAYSGKGTSTKVAKITTNNLGQVTAVEEVDIDFSSVDTKTTYTFTASDSRYSALQDGIYTLTIQNTNKYPIACYNANGEAVMVTLGQANNAITMKTDEKFAGTIVAL